LNVLAGKIRVDFRAQEPLYLQIARQIEQLVAGGGLKPGDQLPTVRELATEQRINFNTVSRAYRILDEAGIISTQRGRGTYIWEMPSAKTTETLRLEGLEWLTQQFIDEATKLGFRQGEIQTFFLAKLKVGSSEKDHQPNSEDKS
jgi:GntR family transcriptional regulator